MKGKRYTTEDKIRILREQNATIKGVASQVHERAYRNRPLAEAQKETHRQNVGKLHAVD